MNRICRRGALLVLTVQLAGGVAAAAPKATTDLGEPGTTIRTEVKREHDQDLKHSSLRFLRDNRVFIRAQLDRLRLQTTRTRDGAADLIDERMLRLQELAAAIGSARDTVAAESARTARRELLASVTQLGDLDQQLSLMENLVAEQARRLQVLEDDFLGRQETALVVLVRGLPAAGTPQGLSLSEDNEVLHVPFGAEQQAGLRVGGVAEVSHRLVEPREHTYAVAFDGPEWQDVPPLEIAVSAARDRITFLELDLSRLAPQAVDGGLTTKVWQR